MKFKLLMVLIVVFFCLLFPHELFYWKARPEPIGWNLHLGWTHWNCHLWLKLATLFVQPHVFWKTQGLWWWGHWDHSVRAPLLLVRKGWLRFEHFGPILGSFGSHWVGQEREFEGAVVPDCHDIDVRVTFVVGVGGAGTSIRWTGRGVQKLVLVLKNWARNQSVT